MTEARRGREGEGRARRQRRRRRATAETLFYPAVVYPVREGMKLYREEQFGPVIPVMPSRTSRPRSTTSITSDHGQQVSIFGTDPDQIGALVDPLVNQVCRVNINAQCQRGPDVFPFAGRKDSAEGTLSVTDALRAFSIRSMVADQADRGQQEAARRDRARTTSRSSSTPASSSDRRARGRRGGAMRRQRNAKIVATLGPASSDAATVRALFDAGADVFRLNFSHGAHADHKERLEVIRRIERETGRPIAVLLELGLHQPARRARAARGADPRSDAGHPDRPPPRARVGRAPGARARDRRRRGDGGERVHARAARGLCAAGRHGRDHRRPAARDRGHHEHARIAQV